MAMEGNAELSPGEMLIQQVWVDRGTRVSKLGPSWCDALVAKEPAPPCCLPFSLVFPGSTGLHSCTWHCLPHVDGLTSL